MGTKLKKLNLRNSYSSLHLIFAVIACCYIAFASIALVLMPVWVAFLFLLPLFIPFLFNRSFVFEPSINLMTKGVFFALILYLLWPRYLAFQLAGPDITPHRIIQFFLILIWFISLASPLFRERLINSFKYSKKVVIIFFLLITVRFLSSLFSDYPFNSLYSFLNELMSCGLLFLMILSLFYDYKKLESIAKILLFSSVAIGILTLYEYKSQSVIFSHIPGLRVNSDYMLQVLSDKFRGGAYRAQSTFSNPLLLAEFAVFIIPIAFYFIINGGSRLVRVIALLSIPLMFFSAYATGSRSGVVLSLFLSAISIGYILFKLILSKKLGMGGWFLILGLIGVVFAGCSILLFGSLDLSYIHGRSLAERQSSEARILMLERGLPLILDKPFFGYGLAMAAGVLGFKGSNNILTIDNYYLSYALDSGFIGLLIFVTLFFITIACMVKFGYVQLRSDQTQDKNIDMIFFLIFSTVGMLAMMLTISLDHNMPLLFIALAMLIAIRRNYLESMRVKL